MQALGILQGIPFKMQFTVMLMCGVLASQLKPMQVLRDEWRYILDKVLGKGPEHCESKGYYKITDQINFLFFKRKQP